jgi:hypothetical protein
LYLNRLRNQRRHPAHDRASVAVSQTNDRAVARGLTLGFTQADSLGESVALNICNAKLARVRRPDGNRDVNVRASGLRAFDRAEP